VKFIAELVGFDSRSHFSQSFSDYFGPAAAEFREAEDYSECRRVKVTVIPDPVSP
jgi:transcriptional regulator GlxA family with amidase domain